MTLITRRNFFGLAGAAVCAPAIVRFTSLMPVRSFVEGEALNIAPGALNYVEPSSFLLSPEFVARFLANARASHEMAVRLQ